MSNTSPRCSARSEGIGPHDLDGQCVLIYDAECRLCMTSKEILEKWDRLHRIKFLPFQSIEAREISPDLAEQTNIDAMRFVETDQRVFVGIEAFRQMLPMLPMGRFLSILLNLPGVSWLAGKIYGVIAKNRIRWFGAC